MDCIIYGLNEPVYQSRKNDSVLLIVVQAPQDNDILGADELKQLFLFSNFLIGAFVGLLP